MARAVLIFGATGKQGGAVINELIKDKHDFEILAVTRNPTSASAQRLLKKSKNLKLVQGDLDNVPEIFASIRKLTTLPVWGVFSVQAPSGFNADEKIEEQQGKSLVDESIKAGVELFVYTSVDRGGESSIDNPTNVPHFISKHNIEQHLIENTKNSSMNWVILRPTAFFENFMPNFFGKVFVTSWKTVVKNKPLQLVSVSDIGIFGAKAFLSPEEFKGKAISLAGDELTFDQLKASFKEETGNELPMTYGFIASFLMWMVKDLGFMFKWFYNVGYGANIPQVKKIHPDLKDFKTWLKTESGFANN